MSRLLVPLAVVCCLLAPAVAAQQLRGVVWTAPPGIAEAQAELLRIRATGFKAVRTAPLPDPLLRTADSLGIVVFADLPFEYPTAAALRRALPQARRQLADLTAQARRYPALRYVGLARRPNTADPATCAVLEDLAATARQGGLRPYYLTAFIESDGCAETVDLVLLSARDAATPERLLNRWRAAQSAPAGLGVVGTWVEERAKGLRAPHSPEAQARFFEGFLTRTDTLAVPVFLYRWRDGTGGTLDDPFRRAYGLVREDGRPRPALAVVRGFLTGTQTAFAFDLGRGGGARGPVPVLFFWLALLFLGWTYAYEPRVRTLAPRYFRARSFYREGLRDARDTLATPTLALALAATVATGVIVAALAEVLRELPAFEFLFVLGPPALARLLAGLIAQPWALVLFVVVVQGAFFGYWTVLFFAVTRRRYFLAFSQALGYIVWPLWTSLPLAAAALVVRTLPAPQSTQAALVVGAAWLVSLLWAGLRTLIDLAAASRVPLGRMMLLILLHPVTLAALVLAFVVADAGPRLAFFLQLARQG
jgi:hypothetical protein